MNEKMGHPSGWLIFCAHHPKRPTVVCLAAFTKTVFDIADALAVVVKNFTLLKF